MDDATHGHNARARRDAITDGFSEIFKLRQQIAAAIEKHVKPLRDHVNDIKQNLREDYELPGKALNVRYAAYELQRSAELDGDESMQDAIRELWDALPIGGSLDLATLADSVSGVTRGHGPAGMPKSVRGARKAGCDARGRGVGIEQCPYQKRNGALAKAWCDGWRAENGLCGGYSDQPTVHVG